MTQIADSQFETAVEDGLGEESLWWCGRVRDSRRRRPRGGYAQRRWVSTRRRGLHRARVQMAKNGARLRSTSVCRGFHVRHHIADLGRVHEDSYTLQLKRGHKGADRREMSWCLCLVRFQTISYNYNFFAFLMCPPCLVSFCVSFVCVIFSWCVFCISMLSIWMFKKPPEQLKMIINCIQLHTIFKIMQTIIILQCTAFATGLCI